MRNAVRARTLALGLVAIALAPRSASAQPLTPEEAISRMVEVSPTLRAADADLAAARGNVQAAEGARIPVLTAAAQGQYFERFGGTAAGLVRNNDQAILGNLGISYTTEIGTQLSLGMSGSSRWQSINLTPGTTDTVDIGPIYALSATLEARQPLFRGAGDDAMLSVQRQAEAAREAAERSRDQTTSAAVLETLSAYWQLWYAQEARQVQERALAVMEQRFEEQRRRVDDLGTVAPADLLQLTSELAAIREGLALAQASQTSAAIDLGRLIGVPPHEAMALVAAADPPEVSPLPALALLIARAQEASSELLALQAQVELARQRLRGAADADQPRLDLFGTFTVAGLWDEMTIETFQLPGDRPSLGGLVGLELELPLGPSQASGQHAAARAELEAAQARYEARAAQLGGEIATLRAQIDTLAAQVELAGSTAEAAAALAEAESRRLALGTTVPLVFVQAQQAEREARLRRLRALVDRLTTELDLLHRTGELRARVGDAR